MGFLMQLLSHVVGDFSLIKALFGLMSKMAHLYRLQFDVGCCLGSRLGGEEVYQLDRLHVASICGLSFTTW